MYLRCRVQVVLPRYSRRLQSIESCHLHSAAFMEQFCTVRFDTEVAFHAGISADLTLLLPVPTRSKTYGSRPKYWQSTAAGEDGGHAGLVLFPSSYVDIMRSYRRLC
ncbi:hypothetical protein COOONC_12457 [Cooperia oncophora]